MDATRTLILAQLAWYALAVSALIVWLWQSRWGTRAFTQAPPRWHRIEVTNLLGLALLWLAVQMIPFLLHGAAADQLGRHILLEVFAGQIVLAGGVLLLARHRFRDGLRGMGLHPAPWSRNLARSLAGFVVGTGLALLVLTITAVFVDIPRHEVLSVVKEHPVLASLTAVIGAPLAEEILFRGILQTFIVGRIGGRTASGMDLLENDAGQGASWGSETWIGAPTTTARWLGIALSAAIWAMVHANWQHAPALLVLGLLLGYLYERYGNILVPIAVHALFNLLQVLTTLLLSGSEV